MCKAALWGNLDEVKRLIRNGANIEERNKNGSIIVCMFLAVEWFALFHLRVSTELVFVFVDADV